MNKGNKGKKDKTKIVADEIIKENPTKEKLLEKQQDSKAGKEQKIVMDKSTKLKSGIIKPEFN